jgi:hypothetical protein
MLVNGRTEKEDGRSMQQQVQETHAVLSVEGQKRAGVEEQGARSKEGGKEGEWNEDGLIGDGRPPRHNAPFIINPKRTIRCNVHISLNTNGHYCHSQVC